MQTTLVAVEVDNIFHCGKITGIVVVCDHTVGIGSHFGVDIVVLLKTNSLERGDLCGFSYSNKILIKRVIGLPGDIIIIDPEGLVYVNGEPLEEPYISEPGLGECDIEFPYTVPEESYFLMGDHRSTSIDSRNTVIGCISKDQIIGKLFFKIWPLEDIQFFN